MITTNKIKRNSRNKNTKNKIKISPNLLKTIIKTIMINKKHNKNKLLNKYPIKSREQTQKSRQPNSNHKNKRSSLRRKTSIQSNRIQMKSSPNIKICNRISPKAN